MRKGNRVLTAAIMAVLAFALCAGMYISVQKIQEETYRYALCGILVILALGCLVSYVYYRRRFCLLSEHVCGYMDEILKGRRCPREQNQETLTSKMVMELEKLSDILETRARTAEEEKQEVRRMVSDISHQLKTPVSNIRMYGDTLLMEEVTKEDEEKFIAIMQQQTDKLEFLVDSLVKMSRLETKMIQLNEENASILNTLALAFKGITGKAEKKNITLCVECRETIEAVHDVKWTAEALENLLDNAVKYTDNGGTVTVKARPGEMYVEIQIIDTGRGIAPEHYNDIFKRFYREKGVEKMEGLGIGLYLSRKIITMQGGYIMVRPNKGEGSVFSVFLPIGAAA